MSSRVYYYGLHGFYMEPDISDAGNLWNNGPTRAGVIVYSIVTPIICFLGILGNTVSLAVLSRRELKGSVYVYLAVLAFNDLVSSTLLFFSGLSSGVLFADEWPIYDIIFGLPLASVFTCMSVLITLMVTFDRCLYMRNPLTCKKPKLCHSSTARRIVIGCFFISILINVPVCFIFESDERGQVSTTEFYYSSFYKCFNWVKFVLLGIVPSLLLIFGNGFLIYSLYKMKNIRAKCNQSIKCKKRRNFTNITLTLVLIIFFFLITQIPTLLTSRTSAISFFFSVDGGSEHCNSEALETVRQISTVINAISLAADFFLYYLFCPAFCKVLVKLFCRHHRVERRAKSVQMMKVFVLDKQIRIDKSLMASGKILEMMDDGNRDSFPSSLDYPSSDRSEEDGSGGGNRKTLITLLNAPI